jgi:nanoRNase/pAp phosphatase (c-di-AMP/oligoRNAs hydrolase)
MSSNTEKLRKLYEQFSTEDHVLIPINADPDSIGSAMAMKRLLWHKVAGVNISNINVVKRPDNLAMIRLLGTKLIPFDKVDITTFNRFALVDSQPTHHPSFSALNFSVVIDHHPITNMNAPFMDIRPAYGATATIMTEYLKAAGIKPSMVLATALFYGIKTDTSNFERQALPEDMRAFQYLFRFINVTLARKIEYAELTLDFLKYYKIALENIDIRANRAYVALGAVVNPDVCVLIADFFMKIYGIDWTFVAGLFEDNLIIIIRNNGIRKDAGKLARHRFGDIGSAGGHKSVARAEIPLNGLKNSVDYTRPKKLLRWIIRKTS